MEKVLNATLFNATSSQNPPASSTGVKIIITNPIPLLSSSKFSQLKINGTQLTSPQFILDTEQTLRIAEYKSSKKNWFSSNLFWLIPNNYPSSLFQSHYDIKISATSKLNLPVPTWANIKHCTACNFGFLIARRHNGRHHMGQMLRLLPII